jgi:DNA-binding CsgD family transcriptional regulator
MKIIYSSQKSTDVLGVNPEALSPYHFFEATHPDDVQRHSLGRAKLFKIAHDLFIAEEGSTLLSTNFRIRNPMGEYPNLLFQLYCYYSTIPYKSVFLIKVHTNIEQFKMRKWGCHYYVGSDMSYFRYPDKELLEIGHVFSVREFEIIKLIELGLSTEEIAGKLFLSPYTINTHRGNILQKSGKSHISEVIYDLKERGVI